MQKNLKALIAIVFALALIVSAPMAFAADAGADSQLVEPAPTQSVEAPDDGGSLFEREAEIVNTCSGGGATCSCPGSCGANSGGCWCN